MESDPGLSRVPGNLCQLLNYQRTFLDQRRTACVLIVGSIFPLPVQAGKIIDVTSIRLCREETMLLVRQKRRRQKLWPLSRLLSHAEPKCVCHNTRSYDCDLCMLVNSVVLHSVQRSFSWNPSIEVLGADDSAHLKRGRTQWCQPFVAMLCAPCQQSLQHQLIHAVSLIEA